VSEFEQFVRRAFVIRKDRPNTTDNQNTKMSTEKTSSSGYMLLFRGTGWHKDLSPEQIQNVMSQWSAWFNRLVDDGILKAGQPLEAESRLVVGKGRTVSDGPFVESKEAIAGYFLLNVDNFDDAVAIARQCPTLDQGVTVEVRPVAEECPHSRLLEQNAAQELLAATT
jgi:hypothetical protein